MLKYNQTLTENLQTELSYMALDQDQKKCIITWRIENKGSKYGGLNVVDFGLCLLPSCSTQNIKFKKIYIFFLHQV
jgi:hypothetical protein